MAIATALAFYCVTSLVVALMLGPFLAGVRSHRASLVLVLLLSATGIGLAGIRG